jgi:transcription elongation factor SPT5
MHGKLQNVKHQSVSKRKVNRNAVALDSENNTLAVNDIVKAVDGVHNVSFCASFHFCPNIKFT